MTLEDLPAGFTEDEVDEKDEDTEVVAKTPDCQKRYDLLEDLNEDVDVEAEVAFAKKPALGLEHGWGSFPGSPEELSSQLALIASIVDDCGEVVITSTDGSSPDVPVRFEPASFPTLGDESFAFTATGEIQGLPLGLSFAFVRIGQNVQSVSLAGLGTPDAALVEKIARLGVERLPV